MRAVLLLVVLVIALVVPSTRGAGGNDGAPQYLNPPPTAHSDLVYAAQFIPHCDYDETLLFLIDYVKAESRKASETCEIIGTEDQAVKEQMKAFNFVWLSCSKAFLPEVDRLNFVASVSKPPFIAVQLPSSQ